MHKEGDRWVPNYVIRSPRECKSIIVKPEDLKYRVLMIHKDKRDLRGTNVLKYIQQGERKGVHRRPTCASRGEKWYELPEIGAHILSKRFVDVTFSFFLNPQELFVGDTFFSISSKDIKSVEFLGAILNSIMWSFFTEIYGRTVMGEGVLLIYGPEIAPMPVFNIRNVPYVDRKRLIDRFGQTKRYSTKSIFEEIGANSSNEISLDKVKPDRRELDKIIMGEILGLTDEEQLEVYRSVIDLVRSRIEKAKSFGKRKKTKEGINIDLLTKTVMDKIGDETLGKFYKENVLSRKLLYTKRLLKLSEPVRVEQELFGWRLYSGKKYIKCSSEPEARYLKVWLETGLEKVKIPKDENYLISIVPELEKTKERVDEIVEDYLSSILDTKIRDKISHQVWMEIVK
jgi:hypothetical protein